MLKILRILGITCISLLCLYAALGLCRTLLSNVVLFGSSLAVFSLTFSLLLLYLIFSDRTTRCFE